MVARHARMLRLTGEEDKTGRSVDRTEDTWVCDSYGMRRAVESANKRAEAPHQSRAYDVLTPLRGSGTLEETRTFGARTI